MTKFWDDLKMRWLFACNFSQLFPTQNAAPSTRHGASLNFPSCSRTNPKLFTAASVSRCSGPRRRSSASRTRCSSGTASAKAPRATSTRASLSRGSPREPKSFPRLRGGERAHFSLVVVSWIQISGSKYFLSSCYRLYLLMLFDAIWCLL